MRQYLRRSSKRFVLLKFSFPADLSVTGFLSFTMFFSFELHLTQMFPAVFKPSGLGSGLGCHFVHKHLVKLCSQISVCCIALPHCESTLLACNICD